MHLNKVTKDIEKLDLFEFINIFFTDKEQYARIQDKVKTQHAWMLYQFLAIYHPREICAVAEVVHPRLIDSLHLAFYSGKRAPRWPSSKSTKTESIESGFDSIVIDAYCNANDIEYKSFVIMCERWPEFVKNGLIDIESQIKITIKRKQKNRA